MKIYVAHQISGLSAEQVIEYYTNTKRMLADMGWEVLSPMTGKGEFRNDIKARFAPMGYTSPFAGNHAIFERDQWMVKQADVVHVDFTGTTFASIGMTMELAWAATYGKHTVVVMEKGNINQHAFILEAADIVLENISMSMEYLSKMIKQDM